MDAGWSWQIEHLERINRGYVYSSDFISDDQAADEFCKKNPKISEPGMVKFRSGRYRNAWVKNVVAIGNSAGFVEPLEATAIAAICSSAKALAESLIACDGLVNPSLRHQFNQYNASNWDTIADFLAVHYKFNNKIDTQFWRECQANVNLRGAKEIVDFYVENGPSSLWKLTLEDPNCRFKLDGYYTLLLGQKVPHAYMHVPTARERAAWQKLQKATHQYAAKGYTVKQTLDIVRSSQWQWQPQHYAA
jgi:tryptophan halogenase